MIKNLDKKILILNGHTGQGGSVANRIIIDTLKSKLPETTVEELAEFARTDIDVAAEQRKLSEADTVVLQFPVFWYSMPSVMHRWIEEVFLHGFSHGSTGKALQGKRLIVSFTSGAPESMGVADIVMPQVKAIAALTGLNLIGSVYTGGVGYALRSDPVKLENIQSLAKAHAERLCALIG